MKINSFGTVDLENIFRSGIKIELISIYLELILIDFNCK